jgi:hypothetical protein
LKNGEIRTAKGVPTCANWWFSSEVRLFGPRKTRLGHAENSMAHVSLDMTNLLAPRSRSH